MKFENRLAGHTNSYHTYGLDDALEGIAAAGFHFVELSAVRGWTEQVPLDADARTLGNVLRKLHALDLVPVSLSGHSDLTTKEGLRDGMRALKLCEELGIPIMNTAIGGHYSEQEDEAGFFENIGELAQAAAARQITVGIEIHGDITANSQKAIPIIERIGHPNVGINYDTANVEFYSGVLAEDDIRLALPYLVHVHLKDTKGGLKNWNFPAVGKGHVDFGKVLRILKRGGYKGPYSVEIEFSGEPWPSLQGVNRAMRDSYRTLSRLGLE